ncbi:MAG: NusG domain II-containing protein [Clostridia bacterium]|jgi:hypothetical protein|nr:NusG domain II-containing protein [Clostridia bacterium]MDD4275668.1 NusG domain II-containing protein [Clostridia bacterium]
MENLEKIKFFKTSKPCKLLDIFIVVVLLISAIFLFIIFKPEKGTYIEIYVDNELYAMYNLDTDREIVINNNGNYNVVEIIGGKVHMKESNCQNQTCVEMGYIDSTNYKIVCAPNNVIVIVINPNADYDGIAG